MCNRICICNETSDNVTVSTHVPCTHACVAACNVDQPPRRPSPTEANINSCCAFPLNHAGGLDARMNIISLVCIVNIPTSNTEPSTHVNIKPETAHAMTLVLPCLSPN